MNPITQAGASVANESNSGLNENHVRHVVITFRYMDELLTKAEQILASAGEPLPFQEYADDSTPIQRKVAHDYVVHLRAMMSRALEEWHISRPEPISGALWAARNAVGFANIALAEMESKRMAGYGQLSEVAAQRIDELGAELRAQICKLDDYLAKSGEADLGARLQRLERTSQEAPLLGEIARVITAHGLVEFRPAVVMLLERLENVTFEIGVFGRVSSGKSSLLNHLLGGEYLPVGVTPVTAVPTRISYGPQPQVTIEFADHRPQVVELSALVEFATEQQNPGNAKHVSRIQVQAPAPRLGEGITFVDTPGLGSLAASGAAETVAYLPRCDLGLVLVDASSTLTNEDLRIIQALYHASATAMVLVSKADMLNHAERQQAVDYVRKQIRSETNAEPPVHPVSVRGAEVELCDHWFETELRPLLDRHRELAAISFKRKVGGLREALLATLKRRTEAESPALSERGRARWQEVEAELRRVPQTLEAARRETEDWARRLRELADSVVEATADELAEHWLRDPGSIDGDEALTEAATRLAREHSTRVRQRVEQIRAALGDVLHSAAMLVPTASFAVAEMPELSALPIPDAAAIMQGLQLRCPAFLTVLGRAALRRNLRAQLREQAELELQGFLSLYGQRLNDWARRSYVGIESAFSANAGIFRAQLGGRQSSTSGETAPNQDSLRADILLLEQWGQAKAASQAQPA
jgi:GTP-binding protein EngB required for normal cell division